MYKLTPYLLCSMLMGLILATPSQATAKRYYVVRDQYGKVTKVIDPTDNIWYKLTHPIQYVTSLVPGTNPSSPGNFYRPVTQADMQKPISVTAAANEAVDSAAQLVTNVTGSSQLGRFVGSVGSAAVPGTPSSGSGGSSSPPSSQPPPSRNPH